MPRGIWLVVGGAVLVWLLLKKGPSPVKAGGGSVPSSSTQLGKVTQEGVQFFEGVLNLFKGEPEPRVTPPERVDYV